MKVFPNKDQCYAEFKDGKIHIFGWYIFANGASYIGQFKADRFEGIGILYDLSKDYNG